MDRRQQKTRKAIFAAFSRLLEEHSYKDITVQDIIDEADIGRSTFYAHFETRDSLLQALCRDIFEHVFSSHLESEKSHDFSDTAHDRRERMTHILYHLKDEKHDIVRLLSGESSDLFLDDLKQYLPALFEDTIAQADPGIPKDLTQQYLVNGFADLIQWWFRSGMQYTPEQITDWYLKIIDHGLNA